MQTHQNLIIVAGTARNVGKTTFICELIRKYAQAAELYGLKVSTIDPCGHLLATSKIMDAPSILYEETRQNSSKDTSRMLRAGARKVFYLKGDNTSLQAGYHQFNSTLPPAGAVICESNSLWQYVKPALLVAIKHHHSSANPDKAGLLENADIILVSDGSSGFAQIDRIGIAATNKWVKNS